MSITRLPEIVFPLTQINKVNEIVDVLNDNLNMYYSATNPALTPVEGVATWVVTHNLGTENVNCSLYNGDNLVISNVSITSDNVITVSFNATTNIAQDTYKIVVISNGAGSASGSGSYVLPTASTTTLGGVRIDGSSITINNGVISSTVDSALSTTSTNPVQNKVITNSLNLTNYVKSTVPIVVASDGSGDFTTLTAAINWLNGKWSDNVVTVTVNPGTYNENSTVTIDRNHPSIFIQGTKNTCIMNNIRFNIYSDSKVWVYALNFVQADNSSYGTVFDVGHASVTVQDCIFTVPGNCISVYNDAQVQISHGNVVEKSNAFAYAGAANIDFQYNADVTIKNTAYAFFVDNGGIIRALKTTLTLTNVTNVTNISQNTWRSEGYIRLNNN